MSAVALESLVTEKYGYAFTRKTLSKLTKERIVAKPEMRYSSAGKNGNRMDYPDEAFFDVLAYLMTCDTLRGLNKGSKLQNKFDFFSVAKVVVDEYKENHQVIDREKIIEHLINDIDVNKKVEILLSRDKLRSSIDSNDIPIIKLIILSLYFFKQLVKGNLNDCLYGNWYSFKKVIIESEFCNDNFKNNIFNMDSSKNGSTVRDNGIEEGIYLWSKSSEIFIKSLNSITKLVENGKEQRNVIAWLDVICTFDNNSRWVSKKAYNFFEDCGVALPFDCFDNMFLYASILKTIGILKI